MTNTGMKWIVEARLTGLQGIFKGLMESNNKTDAEHISALVDEAKEIVAEIDRTPAILVFQRCGRMVGVFTKKTSPYFSQRRSPRNFAHLGV